VTVKRHEKPGRTCSCCLRVSWGVLTVVWKDWVEENELGCYNVASDWQKEAGT